MNFDMIRESAKRGQGIVRRTPLLNSPFLDEIAGRRVFIKCECLQHTGSFKFRGGWSAVTGLKPQNGVIAYSSGNHAQGVAAAAAAHDLPAVIVMPSDAPKLKLANTAALGAEVVTYDRAHESREDIGNAIAQDRELTLIRPFDEPFVIAGQGTTGLEIAEQSFELEVDAAEVLVPCGGGGLTSGIALALEELAPHLTVRPVEPEGFDDVARSLELGSIQTNNRTSGSLADAILTNAPGDLTFPILRKLAGPGLVVGDEAMLRALALAFLRLKVVIEPGGASALAAALFKPDLISGDDVIVVASGGNVDPPVFQRALDSLEA